MRPFAAGFLGSLMFYCLDCLSEFRCLTPQSVDNFEVRLCTLLPKPASQGCSCVALSHQCPSILLVENISFVCPKSTNALKMVGLSTSPQGWQSFPERFLAGLVCMYGLCIVPQSTNPSFVLHKTPNPHAMSRS